MRPGLVRSSVHRLAQCVVALVTFVSVVAGLITIRRGDLHGRPWVGWGVLPAILPTSWNRARPPSPAGDREGHPYGLSGLLPIFMVARRPSSLSASLRISALASTTL